MRARIRRLAILAMAAVFAALLPGVAAAASGNDFPETAVEAMARYEADPDKFLDGPVSYLVLDEERDLFKRLQSTEQRAEFVQWFWDRRDEDLRVAGNVYRDRFYQRVAEANARYSDFPRGWKSDRGRVHVLLGSPDARRPHFGYFSDATVWTYFTVGPRSHDRPFGSTMGEISIAFLRTGSRASYQFYGGFGGPGVLPLYVRDTLQIARDAALVDPFLEATFVN